MGVGERTATVIRGDSVSYSFGGVAALREISLTIRCPSRVLVTGPSGAGKSTLLHCLAGVLVPSGGSVVGLGVDYATATSDELADLRRRSFGFVFQSGLLIDDLNNRENVALPAILDGRRRQVALDRADELLEQFGITEVAARRPREISGGQAQRVAVARALVNDPAIVFADEPTGNLDDRNAAIVVESLIEHTHDRALVVVSHDVRLRPRFECCMHLIGGRLHDPQR